MQMFVKSTVFDWTHAENTITIETEVAMSIGIIKATIHDMETVPMDEQVLSFEGQELEDDYRLADYNIQDKSTLVLTMVMGEGAPRDGAHRDGGLRRTPPWRAEAFLARNVRARTEEADNAPPPPPGGAPHPEEGGGALISSSSVHLMRQCSYSDITGYLWWQCSCTAEWLLFPTRAPAPHGVIEIAAHVGNQEIGAELRQQPFVCAACKVECRSRQFYV